NQETACEIAARLIASIRQPIRVDTHEFQIGASIGVALFPDHGRSVAEILHQADMAMYAAKRSRAGLAVAPISPDPSKPIQAHLDPTDMVFDYIRL
ncbi:MAG: diguanylate cyclase, partial [Isosphaeraceae bacterium]